MQCYFTWIFDDFFQSIDMEYDDTYYNILYSEIEKWNSLLIRTMTVEEEDELNLIFVIEKITEKIVCMEDAFASIIQCLKHLNILKQETIELWKNKEISECGYNTLKEFVSIDEDLHKKLVNLIN